jgi:MYXO-CTERM domain-containing protein
MTRAGAAALVVGTLAAALLPSPARAYVRYMSSEGMVFAWPQSCVPIKSYPGNFIDMPAEEVQAAASGAADAWSAVKETCTYLAITVMPASGAAPRAVNDHRNALIFRTATWCDLLADGKCAADIGPYEAAALAVTSVIANRDTGAIRDADIEVNAFHHRWADLMLHPEKLDLDPGVQDLQNALTHEMGHLIGLDHTCFPASLDPKPLTNEGVEAPDCGSVGAEVLETTMFPSANAGDLEKRSLADDDRKALCEIYPVAADPNVCSPAEEGCNCAAGGSPGPIAETAAGLIVLAGLRRRRRRGA